MSQQPFAVVARLSWPDLQAERRYVVMEREVAKQRLAQAPGWLPFSYPGIGLLRRQDWQKYLRQLEAYGHAIDRYDTSLHGGRIPLSFEVFNLGHTDHQIRIHIFVEGGNIHAAQKAPERPPRVDGAPNKAKKHHWQGYEGFSRTGIHIGRRGLESQFSALASGDSALVVNEPLHIDISPQSQLSYHIHSRNLPEGVHGAVILPG
jgi:hypothetical protein